MDRLRIGRILPSLLGSGNGLGGHANAIRARFPTARVGERPRPCRSVHRSDLPCARMTKGSSPTGPPEAALLRTIPSKGHDSSDPAPCEGSM